MEHPSDDTFLRSFLAQRDQPCPSCGYNLRGLTSDVCPECRLKLRLEIALVETHLRTYVLTLIGLSACGSAFALGLLGIGVVSIVEGAFLHTFEALLCLIVLPVAIVATDTTVLLRLGSRKGRIWFRGRTPSGRWVLCAGAWAFSLTVFAAWMGLTWILG